MPTFLFWNRNRSGIHINIIRMLYAFWYMGMPIQQNVSFLKRWQIALIKMMTMCGINYIFLICDYNNNLPEPGTPAPSGLLPYHNFPAHREYPVCVDLKVRSLPLDYSLADHFWAMVQNVTKQ